jgi:penicillin-insensitive murein endopeptidase
MIMRRVRPGMYRSSRSVRLLLGFLALAGCGFAPLPRDASSYGFPSDGVLLGGVALPQTGPGFVRAKPGDDTRWGSPALVALIERAAGRVAALHAGTAPLYVGDLSGRGGGHHGSHGSHRTGRDVDVLFYLSDAHGRSVRGSGFYAFDRRGVSVRSDEAAGGAARAVAYFDTARNWALVRELVLDEAGLVQWIFCADGIKARLLAHAAEHEPDPRALLRASYVLHQPSKGRNHDDHFHVRIACSARDRALGCGDPGPVWPWWRNEHEKPAWDGAGHDDATLVRELMSELEPQPASARGQ